MSSFNPITPWWAWGILAVAVLAGWWMSVLNNREKAQQRKSYELESSKYANRVAGDNASAIQVLADFMDPDSYEAAFRRADITDYFDSSVPKFCSFERSKDGIKAIYRLTGGMKEEYINARKNEFRLHGDLIKSMEASHGFLTITLKPGDVIEELMMWSDR